MLEGRVAPGEEGNDGVYILEVKSLIGEIALELEYYRDVAVGKLVGAVEGRSRCVEGAGQSGAREYRAVKLYRVVGRPGIDAPGTKEALQVVDSRIRRVELSKRRLYEEGLHSASIPPRLF